MTQLKFLLMAALLSVLVLPTDARKKQKAVELWPDGTPIDAWFSDTSRVDVESLGRKYVITDFGVQADSTILQTAAIQSVIDKAAAEGGGVVVVPRGTFLTGALFFKQGTHLHLQAGGMLKGIDAIKHYPLLMTRMEGQTLKYFSALINADGVDGFTITGQGTINGNGLRFWEEFWIRREFNRQCTNLEALRPRLVYISNSRNVQVQDVHLINSPFWTNHIYNSERVKYIGCHIFAPTSGVKAPSSDAIDIDKCHDVLVHNCYMSVNDDAVVLKGGKGTWADKDSTNGPCYNIIVQHCNYGKVHGCLTLGSESLHDWNVVFRNNTFQDANRVLWLKMRPDTPQHYEKVRLENLTGTCRSFLVVRPWTQFFKPEERSDMPLSTCNDICIKNIDVKSHNFFDVGKSDKYQLKDFSFENCTIQDETLDFNPELIPGTTIKNVTINNLPVVGY